MFLIELQNLLFKYDYDLVFTINNVEKKEKIIKIKEKDFKKIKEYIDLNKIINKKGIVWWK